MKFKVGEIAITARDGTASGTPRGTEVTVYAVGPWKAGDYFEGSAFLDDSDYIVLHPDGGEYTCEENFLRKRPQPGIPESILRIFEVEAKQERPA